jgi:hypothetical protein
MTDTTGPPHIEVGPRPGHPSRAEGTDNTTPTNPDFTAPWAAQAAHADLGIVDTDPAGDA